MSKTQAVRSDEKGFASLVVALIMIIVLSLLMVGFARLARREQQNSLDKQLATQAYYAAESGINDLKAKLPQINAYTANPTAGAIVPTSCLNAAQAAAMGLPSGDIDGPNGISYTCALVNVQPDSLVRAGLGARSAWQTSFSTTGSLSSLKISWGSGSHGTFRTNTQLTPLSQWGDAPGLLQFSITPLSDPSRQGLTDSTFAAYLYPESGASGTAHYLAATDPANTGPKIVPGNCSGGGTYTCNVTVDSLPSAPNEYYMIRITDYYQTSDISINTLLDAGGNKLNTVDGQAQLDVTGKAKNVLKRLQVRTPIGAANEKNAPLPPDALDGQSICKRASTYPGASPTYDPLSDACKLDVVR